MLCERSDLPAQHTAQVDPRGALAEEDGTRMAFEDGNRVSQV